MRLTDLDPRWLVKDGVRIGFTFISPMSKSHPEVPGRKPWRQSCFSQPTPTRLQWDLFDQAFGDEDSHLIQGCEPECGWTIAGGIETASFETMTVTPSLDGSKGGLWHGYITNGEIK